MQHKPCTCHSQAVSSPDDTSTRVFPHALISTPTQTHARAGGAVGHRALPAHGRPQRHQHARRVWHRRHQGQARCDGAVCDRVPPTSGAAGSAERQLLVGASLSPALLQFEQHTHARARMRTCTRTCTCTRIRIHNTHTHTHTPLASPHRLRGLRLGNFEYAADSLQLGHLAGNCFHLIMRSVAPTEGGVGPAQLEGQVGRAGGLSLMECALGLSVLAARCWSVGRSSRGRM